MSCKLLRMSRKIIWVVHIVLMKVSNVLTLLVFVCLSQQKQSEECVLVSTKQQVSKLAKRMVLRYNFLGIKVFVTKRLEGIKDL